MKRAAIQHVYGVKNAHQDGINRVGNTETSIRVLALITESLCHPSVLSGLQPFCASYV